MKALWSTQATCLGPVRALLLFLAVAFASCGDYLQDPATRYPECIGTADSFNPYHPAPAYAVTMRGADTFSIRMIFTNYTHTHWPSYYLPMWHLWVASTKGTETRYYDGACYPAGGEKNQWFGISGLLYKGEYANCDFIFNNLDCNELEGSCIVVPAATFDSLEYHFTGRK